jgi:hypothetical protein
MHDLEQSLKAGSRGTSHAARMLVLSLLFAAVSISVQAQSELAALNTALKSPPKDSRIMMRWWWFGPAVVKTELKRELEQMKSAGVGGVEIATLYPQALDNPTTGFHNVPYLSSEYIDDLRYVAREAHALGLRVDLTLGSGWPLGGPHIPVTEAAGELRVEMVPVAADSRVVKAPSLEAGEQLIEAFVLPGAFTGDLHAAEVIHRGVDGSFILQSANSKPQTVIFFISSRTGMMVKRPAVGAAGFVLDHYDKRATQNQLLKVDSRMLEAFREQPPYAVFSDSLEVYGSDWSPGLLAEFRRRRGYDITPYLPALIGDVGPNTSAVRHDWGRTLTELANENFLEPLHAWAAQHHTLLRSQTYGFPPVTLSSNRYADLPEGEGKATINMWRAFSDTRWAASAGHLFGHNVISSETWTWLHSPAFQATPLDMKAEANLHFLQGINQLVGHGWPYSPPGEPEPGWRMYAAAALNDHNPWFPVMPELTKYLQRVSYALRQGKPANDVALLLPNDDVWASFTARIEQKKSATSAGGFDETGSNVSIDESMDKFLDKRVIPQILDAGFNLDFIDGDAIDAVGIPYKVLVLPGINRLPLATYQRIVEFAKHGGIVIATKSLPSTAPGLLHAQQQTKSIQDLSRALFEAHLANAHFLKDEEELGNTLAHALEPDFRLAPARPEIGFIHRTLPHADMYFVANTSNLQQRAIAHFRASERYAEEVDPVSGLAQGVADARNIPLELNPYESRLFIFSDEPVPSAPVAGSSPPVSKDISRDWRITLPSGKILQMAEFRSWTDIAELKNYSGTATYEKTIDWHADDVRAGYTTFIDFGKGTPVPQPNPLGRFNMRAYLDSPIRETAQVYVNGHLAGAVWQPPYRIDISRELHAGSNQLRIVVANTAINELAGESLPDYRLLYARYGTLFIPQDMENLQPEPSGMLGKVTLEQTRSSRPVAHTERIH